LREQALWWLETALRDLQRAERCLDSDDRGAAVFWAQQAAEKALKALLLAFKGGFPRTHSIRRLVEELGLELGLSREELEEAYELTQYYYLPRYPDIVEGTPDEAISRRTAERAVSAARRIVEAAERALEAAGGGRPGVG
jgi:HEPN domain-containing protein